jgi:hypothetical protein
VDSKARDLAVSGREEVGDERHLPTAAGAKFDGDAVTADE